MAGQYTDRELSCVDCGTPFTFSAGEQERFAELGFTNEPKRCGPCRAAKKKAGGGGFNKSSSGGSGGGGFNRNQGGSSGPREMHTAVCATCGGEAKVPFKPRGDRPVYCSNCFDRSSTRR